MLCDMWTKDAQFTEIIKSQLAKKGSGSALKELQQQLRSLRQPFRELNRHRFVDIYAQLVKARNDLV